MIRAALKGAGLFAFGRMPGGARLYRELTRRHLGTQATHVDKLQRVWPGYMELWRERCGLEIDGLRVWVHEGGWTAFPQLVSFLLSGQGAIVTNHEAELLDRYLARSVNGSLACDLPADLVPAGRRGIVEPLRWMSSAKEAIESVGGSEVHVADVCSIPLADGSADLCHSGGVLEHYRPDALRGFLAECHRVLAPGGIASHVFDHRDHLHHADRRLPFLAHLALPGPLYSLLCGHPLAYHNRLLPGEVAALFEEAGFEQVALRRMILPERRYVEGDEALAGTPGIRRALLARRFRAASDADLRTAAAHYLYRKPM